MLRPSRLGSGILVTLVGSLRWHRQIKKEAHSKRPCVVVFSAGGGLRCSALRVREHGPSQRRGARRAGLSRACSRTGPTSLVTADQRRVGEQQAPAATAAAAAAPDAAVPCRAEPLSHLRRSAPVPRSSPPVRAPAQPTAQAQSPVRPLSGSLSRQRKVGSPRAGDLVPGRLRTVGILSCGPASSAARPTRVLAASSNLVGSQTALPREAAWGSLHSKAITNQGDSSRWRRSPERMRSTGCGTSRRHLGHS